MFGNGAEGKIKERTTMKIVTLAALVLIGAGNWAVACQNGNCDRNATDEPVVTTPLIACDNRNCGGNAVPDEDSTAPQVPGQKPKCEKPAMCE
jgi:hypothetical protein